MAIIETVFADSGIYTIQPCLEFQEMELHGPHENRREGTVNAPDDRITRHRRGIHPDTEINNPTVIGGQDACDRRP